ncbi:MAG: hypothetical protein HQL49_08490 [Gammaproteobacteria bacterium]|nr:hypothetical protein [Gammaproteobacteria bacterium]
MEDQPLKNAVTLWQSGASLSQVGEALQTALRANHWSPLPVAHLSDSGARVLQDSLSLTLLKITKTAHPPTLTLDLGLFFNEELGGCSCGDPISATPAYRQLSLTLDLQSAAILAVNL